MTIRHGNITVIYAHLKMGSIPRHSSNRTCGERGDKIGLAGIRAIHSAPHLHSRSRPDTTRCGAVPEGSVLDRAKIKSDQSGPWVR